MATIGYALQPYWLDSENADPVLSVWSTFLIASVAIGLFLLVILLSGRKSNPQATYLFSGMLLLLVANNLDNWLFASGLWQDYPMAVGFSRASILFFGPIIYFYAKSIVLPGFRLRFRHLVHAVPYLIAYSLTFAPLYLQGEEMKRIYIRMGMEYEVPLPEFGRAVLIGYIIQVTAYLTATLRFIRAHSDVTNKEPFIVPVEERFKWLRKVAVAFAAGYSALTIPLAWAVISGTYSPVINYTGTAAYSLIIFYLGVHVVRYEPLILPGFARKYQSLQFSDEQRRDLIRKLQHLVQVKKVYLSSDLTLGSLADQLGVPSGYLSRLINEEYGKGFPDFINSLRVDEFKRLATDPAFKSHSVYGLAMEVGFNSKSSFNAAFKKFTGSTPSEFKKT